MKTGSGTARCARGNIQMKVTYFGTTTLLFDDGKDQILFDAHLTRPSIGKYVLGAKACTDTALCDKLIRLHHMDRLRAVFICPLHPDSVWCIIDFDKIFYESYIRIYIRMKRG